MMKDNTIKAAMKVYAITDRTWLGEESLANQVEQSLKGGVTLLQLREKDLEHEEFLKEAIQIGALCHKYKVPFIINDSVEIACRVRADGVHIGQSDMELKQARQQLGPEAIIGVSVQTLEQALEAQENGADYLGVGAVFPTETKSDARMVSRAVLTQICSSVKIPVVAIGGITEDNIRELVGTGINGVSVISAIYGSAHIEDSARNIRKQVELITGEMKKVLTIAGSDCSGGAGIQADIKTITVHGAYGMSAITALTAQNTTGVYGVLDVGPDFVAQQIDCIYQDIRPDAVKIGMVSSKEIIRTIIERLSYYKEQVIVLDPVMVATSGSNLISEDAMEVLIKELLPLGTIITPNIPEAERICGFSIESEKDMVRAAKEIGEHIPGAVLIKGGHFEEANDLLYKDGKIHWFRAPRIENPNTHGTGCTLSSAIATNLANGYGIVESVGRAKEFLSGAIEIRLDIGKGRGPLNHMYRL